ncbi:MAG: hypothetical protein QOK06_2631 [Acidimicrobiaceae bacterium]
MKATFRCLFDFNLLLNIDPVSQDHSLNSFTVDSQQPHRGLLISFRVIEHSSDVISLHLC